MQNLMNFGKQAYSEYQASQQGHQGQGGGQFGVEGSAALNSSDNNRPPQTGSKSVNTVPHTHLYSCALRKRV